MAKKDDKKEKKIVLERVYNIPLRKKYMRAPRWKKTNRAVKAIREFAMKHMKATEVKIGKHANLEMWKHGIRNPPHHIKVNCKKDNEGIVQVEIVGAPEDKPKAPPNKTEKETEIQIKDALGGEDAEKKDIKEDKSEEAKKVQKEEIKELKETTKKTHAPKQAPMPKRVDTHPNAPLKKG